MSDAKILLFDIETAPNLASVWDLWQNGIQPEWVVRDWYILCWAAKWLGSPDIMSESLPDYPASYREDPVNDLNVTASLWALLDEADIVVAHNGDKFDIPRAHARFVYHNMLPPDPPRQVDTYKISKQFGFTSKKLDALGKFLGVGSKVDHEGGKLWRRVEAGDRDAWRRMVEYCRGDVALLERVYLRLRPWAKTHPNVALYSGRPGGCRICGSTHLHSHGWRRTAAGIYRRWNCQSCGHRQADKKNELTALERKMLMTRGEST